MKNFLEIQPYRITIAKHGLGITECRVMANVLHQLQPFMTKERSLLEKQKDFELYINIVDLVVSRNFAPLRSALECLINKIVKIEERIKINGKIKIIETALPLILKYKYEHGSNKVKLTIGKELLPELLDISKGFTRYNLEVAFNTSTSKIFRLYQFISHYRDKKSINLTIESLRKFLELGNKYSAPRNIKQWILDPAMKELKEKADVYFSIASRNLDRKKMIGWTLNIHHNKKPNELENLQALQADTDIMSNTKQVKVPIIEEGKKQTLSIFKLEQEKILMIEQYEEKIREIKEKAFREKTIKNYKSVHRLKEEEATKIYVEASKERGHKAFRLMDTLQKNIECGKIENPRAYTIKALSNELNIKI